MKVPYRWLADYVEMDVSETGIDRMAERLTLAGIEVEGIERIDPIADVVVGRVVGVRPHPNADRLTLCTVDVGDQTVEVVCGAANVVQGALVPLALEGALLPGGHRIEKRKVRGEVSHGMICSKEELDLEDRSEGIWILDGQPDVSVGRDLSELLEYDDAVFDFKVASNRPDCASVYGVAREVAAILDRPLRPLETGVRESTDRTVDQVSIVIEDPTDTPRYALRMFENVRVGPAPLRIQHRLIKAGMRPLSSVVDATNYAMLEVGQPLHPFDAEEIGETITIRRALDGEAFRTLDGVARTLSDEALLITDERGGIALAGVMGGERGEIQATTNRVLLEIASFRSYTIRQSSRSVGLRTEASQRFERGLDPEGVRLAADRASYWIQTLTDCDVLEGLADAYPAPSTQRTIRLRPHRACILLGIEVDAPSAAVLLKRLGIDAEVSDSEVTAVIPFHRPDLEREVDLVEEVGRIYGYDRFPSTPPTVTLRIGRKDRIERGKDRLREILVGEGMYEVLTDGFDDRPSWREALGFPEQDRIAVRNPMAASQEAMRVSLFPGILGVVETNLSVGVEGGRIFELGRVFSRSAGERERLAGALFGRTGRPLRGKEVVDAATARGVVESLISSVHLDSVETRQDEIPTYLHPGRSARFLRNGNLIGHLGELAPSLVERLAVPTTVFLFEFDIDALFAAFDTPASFTPLPRYPASKRDLSLTAPVAVPERRIREALRSEPTLESILLYDLYRGEQIGEGKKSLTYELAFRAADGTLTDEQVAAAVRRIESRLRELDVHVRAE